LGEVEAGGGARGSAIFDNGADQAEMANLEHGRHDELVSSTDDKHELAT
jgi:hypothetical protein